MAAQTAHLPEKEEEVTIQVKLPVSVWVLLQKSEARDPGFIRRILIYGLTRKEIFRRMKGRG